ncbi:hypothetical protein C8Q75DRAFT_314455 [Abortiporus biennis]|nr:hypothetical protein C8Q75DRAFT_314455 [Abortiporus biennis]
MTLIHCLLLLGSLVYFFISCHESHVTFKHSPLHITLLNTSHPLYNHRRIPLFSNQFKCLHSFFVVERWTPFPSQPMYYSFHLMIVIVYT